MKEKFYITTAIDYVNATPHLGHALEKVQADAIVRYQRIIGKEVFFLTGTDEHGAKIARAAEKSGKDIEEFVEENVQEFRSFWKKLGISNDDFIRTSDEMRHYSGVREMWSRIKKAGDIYKKLYQGLYCLGCEAFITKKDLIDGKCSIHEAEPEKIEEENYFFRLSKYSGRIKELIIADRLEIVPAERKNEILSFIDMGVDDISISRPAKDISWGIPVPADASQTIYVWFEALISYISVLGFGNLVSDKFSRFWPADVQIIGKDILRFHALMWPAMLISAGLPLPKKIFVHGYITVGGKKMSKSLGNAIDPSYYADAYGTDALRYYLLRAISTFEDGDFSEDKFKAVYEGDLANGLGNYISRVSKMIREYFESFIAKPDEGELLKVSPRQHLFFLEQKQAHRGDIEPETFESFIKRTKKEYFRRMENFNLNQSIVLVFEFLKNLDRYIDEYQPFKLIKNDRLKTQAVLWNSALGAVEAAAFLRPFLPETSEKIFKIFGVKPEEEVKTIQVSEHLPLFPRRGEKPRSL